MTTDGTNSKAMLWSGRVLATLIVLFMLFDGAMKLTMIKPVIDATTQLGYPTRTIRPIGVAAIVAALLYAFPQTAVLGAILLTGFLGGAIATHVRVGDNFVIQALIPILAWLGLFLRDPRLRALLPLRTRP